MFKSVLISIILLYSTTSCTWLANHPKVEADLEKEAIDVAKDSEKVIEDTIMPAVKVAP